MILLAFLTKRFQTTAAEVFVFPECSWHWEMEWSHSTLQPVSFILPGIFIFKVVILTNVSFYYCEV